MKISVNDQELYTLSEIQKRVIQNDIHGDEFDEDMKRRLQWILMHKYERCFKRLKDEWEPKLAASGVEAIPTNPDKFAALVFAQSDYKSKKDREGNNG